MMIAEWGLLNWAAAICLVFLTIGLIGAVYRIVRGPSILDRAIATDVLLITLSSGLVVAMVLQDTTDYIIFVVVASVIGFVGSVTLARYTVDAVPEVKRHMEDAEHTDHEHQAGRSSVTGRNAEETLGEIGAVAGMTGSVDAPDSPEGTLHGADHRGAGRVERKENDRG
ncbi:monovalent cation/H+ antiporter complex subunit F [Citricoccus muralis]|uniref:Monovalent cation/H+ antiporter complex subunit F n=1 Tax=Citricoccus muralis TaxID=169134 RepID=A0ABY8H552_9MICC|nr:monovalent cation/H+ antiporter complex subunit F [Citricoccus muralis]WFP16061.1 monovalent cation/H+ antiporter complex subunit F [Citricoccus muralis]